MALSYNPLRCDLCGSVAYDTTLFIDTNRGMTSDSRVVARSLKKIKCLNCGLVRDGIGFDSHDLQDHYANAYQLNTTESGEEHIFFTSSGTISRSQFIHDWILQIKPSFFGRTLEVGCGQGSVLRRLAVTFPDADFHGMDLNAEAVRRAQEYGLKVSLGGSADISGQYDTIVAFGVLEHVPSPSEFLLEIRSALTDGGDLIVGQPSQDVPSYDLFFVDHLHHFATKHVRAFGHKVGLEEQNVLSGYQFVPNFSLHRFTKSSVKEQAFPLIQTPSIDSVKYYLEFFAEVNRFVMEHQEFAVFGTGEVFSLLYAYTDLPCARIVCGLDDNRDRQKQNRWPFRVVSPDQAASCAVSDVLLCVNPRYNQMVSARLTALGLKPTAILDEF